MVLGRLIRRTDSASLSIIRPTLVTKIFVTGDVFSFFVQAGGGGMLVQAKSKSDVQRGENIILGGLILQIIIFAFFVVVASIWHKRLSKNGTAASTQISWKKYISFLYGASALVMIRNTCRVIEYAMGKVSSPPTLLSPYSPLLLQRLTFYHRRAISSPTNGHSTSTTSYPCYSSSSFLSPSTITTLSPRSVGFSPMSNSAWRGSTLMRAPSSSHKE
jgi:hypothetical protein